MKKYIKPIAKTEMVTEINEPVSLRGSGWYNSDCYQGACRVVQVPETGRNSYVIQLDVRHNSDPLVCDYGWHKNHEQYVIFQFPTTIPDHTSGYVVINVSGTDSTYPLEFDPDDYTRARIHCRYMQETTDNIGSGGTYLYIDGVDPYDLTAVNSYKPTHVYAFDNPWRVPAPAP